MAESRTLGPLTVLALQDAEGRGGGVFATLVPAELAYAHDMDFDQARASRTAILSRYHELAVSHLGTAFLRTQALKKAGT